MFNQDGATGSAPPKHESSRLRSLDGLRGVAIIVVIVWHCYGEFSNLLPFGDRFSFYPVRTGWAAVQLFFLISGFVILMTLEKCQTFSEFAWRRWLRLFPAMFVGSIIILAFDWTFATGPYADRTVINLLPGWLFVSPQLLHAVTGLNIDSMDGPFWSLYVEVCFYVVFGVSYFKLGRRGAISVLLVLFALSAIASTLLKLGFGGEPLNSVSGVFNWWLGPIHFGWFASGALFYIAFRNQDYRIFRAAIIVAIVSALYDFEDWRRAVFALLTVVAVFSCALATSGVGRYSSGEASPSWGS